MQPRSIESVMRAHEPDERWPIVPVFAALAVGWIAMTWPWLLGT